jgi:hypothetical protein
VRRRFEFLTFDFEKNCHLQVMIVIGFGSESIINMAIIPSNNQQLCIFQFCRSNHHEFSTDDRPTSETPAAIGV